MKSILLSIILFFITTFAFAQPVLLGTFEVLRVVDGDTIVCLIDNQKRYVRLIGADTPETVKRGTPIQPYGKEATVFTRQAIADSGNKVTLWRDIAKRDRYGRSLAIVYVETENGEKMLNEILIREGLAKFLSNYKYSQKIKQLFIDAENTAKIEKKGIHSEH
jgi:micrococcal nuclease